jgi:hypothetical protein
MSQKSKPNDPREGVHADRASGRGIVNETVTINETQNVSIHVENEEFTDNLGLLNHGQLATLRRLIRLHRSLRGPQALLESAGHFNRPSFPAAPDGHALVTSNNR